MMAAIFEGKVPKDPNHNVWVKLADSCLAKGAKALGTTGRPFTDKTIGGALASRELMQELRQTGAVTGGPAPFRKEDRSRFLSALDNIIQALRREQSRGERGTTASS